MIQRLLLLAILLLAVAARFWGIDFGLPQVLCKPDEEVVVSHALTFFLGDWNPHFFNYPSLYLYLVHFLQRGIYWWGLLLGEWSDPIAFVIECDYRPALAYMPGRILSALLGVWTVYLVYAIGRELRAVRAGLIGAFFLACGYLHARQSHFGVTDVAAVFFSTGSILELVKLSSQSGTRKNFIAAAIWAGLATSTKYIGCFLFVPAAILQWVLDRKSPKPRGFWRGVFLPMFLFGLLMIAAFIVTTPYSVLATHELIRDLKYESEFLDTGYHPIGDPGWIHHPRFTLPIGMGESVFILGVFGLLFLVRKNWRAATAIALFPLLYFLITGGGRAVFVRYILPFVPSFTFLAGFLVDEFWQRMEPRLGRVARPLLVVLVGLIALPSALRLWHFDRLNAETDTRALAADWLLLNAHGQTMAQLDVPYARLSLPDAPVDTLKRMTETVPMEYHAHIKSIIDRRAQKSPVRWVEEWKVMPDGTFTHYGEKQVGWPDFIVVERSRHKDMWAERQTLVEQIGYERVAEFRSLPDEGDHRFDLQDAYFIPYDGFADVERPGPKVVIYKKKATARKK